MFFEAIQDRQLEHRVVADELSDFISLCMGATGLPNRNLSGIVAKSEAFWFPSSMECSGVGAEAPALDLPWALNSPRFRHLWGGYNFVAVGVIRPGFLSA